MWINVPTCPSAPAAADSTSDWNWLWEAFAQSVGWSGKPSPSSTWQRRWKRDAWLKRLCGRICEPSMADRGVESWIASLRATRASRSVSPASVVDRTILDTFGRTSLESLAKWNRQSCFSKTCPAILASASSKSPAIFKQWVTALRRASLARRKSAQATGENGSSSSRWQTIKASDGEKGGPNQRDGKGNPYLPMQAALGEPDLQQPGADVNKLVTKDGDPATTVNQRLYRNGLHRTVGLPQQAALWKTPNSVDWKGANPQWEKAAPSCNQRRQQTDESARAAPYGRPRERKSGASTTAGTTMWR